MRPAQLCTENDISIYMCSAVEVTWLAQNFWHNSTRVWFRTIAKKFSIGVLDIIKLSKIPLIYSVSRFNLGGLKLCPPTFFILESPLLSTAHPWAILYKPKVGFMKMSSQMWQTKTGWLTRAATILATYTWHIDKSLVRWWCYASLVMLPFKIVTSLYFAARGLSLWDYTILLTQCISPACIATDESHIMVHANKHSTMLVTRHPLCSGGLGRIRTKHSTNSQYNQWGCWTFASRNQPRRARDFLLYCLMKRKQRSASSERKAWCELSTYSPRWKARSSVDTYLDNFQQVWKNAAGSINPDPPLPPNALKPFFFVACRACADQTAQHITGPVKSTSLSY